MFTFEIDDHVYLKVLDLQDAPAIFALIQNSKAHLRPWMPWADATNKLEDTEAFIRTSMQDFGSNSGLHAGIWHKGQAAGVIGFHQFDWTNKTATIGYWLGEAFCGKGLMTKAGHALLKLAFDYYHLERVELRAATENKASQAVAERLGFTKEGVIRHAEVVGGARHDHVVYGLLKNEWQANTPK
ncbi:ribosomal-protein-serine acetyltransferase [Niallia circulans]|uniref:GNAT family N-acetyltransferase n=1 Tax=Shouchella clausii TaxID=79880 RepID=UPI000BA5EFE6|nr:GNAT family protein [Shouchella clausii]MCM3548642.1 GNAT family N-acetyltransferase [Shouchella clausii]PAF12052.1 RimJ/RimL family protein N-acetyltransferase [Shouchella clausii]SPT81594.1 ribosomal-protein-serine acetyltransferase [Niallia circulans]